MKNVVLTPAAHNDLIILKDYLTGEFGKKTADKIVGAIYDDLDKLSTFPKMGVDLFAKLDIESNYLCLITHKNYAFYRIEDENIKVIRILDERRDYLGLLFGIHSTNDDID